MKQPPPACLPGFTTTLFIAEGYAENLRIPIFTVFGLILPQIQTKFTVVDALSTQDHSTTEWLKHRSRSKQDFIKFWSV